MPECSRCGSLEGLEIGDADFKKMIMMYLEGDMGLQDDEQPEPDFKLCALCFACVGRMLVDVLQEIRDLSDPQHYASVLRRIRESLKRLPE